MRKALIVVLILLVFPAIALASESTDPNKVAQGAEKAVPKEAHPTENSGGAHEQPETYFGVPAWILKILNLIAFWGFLFWLIGGPVKKALASRRESIRLASEQAVTRRQKADQIASEIQGRLDVMEQEVRAIQERAQVEGERQKREMIAAAEAEAVKIMHAAKVEVENRLKRARQELTEMAGVLASERAEALLRERITDQDRHKLFEESLQQVGETRA